MKFIFFIIILISASSLLPYNTINLELDKKPDHVQVYNWCTKKAEIHVKKYKNEVMKILNISFEQLENIKKRIVYINNNPTKKSLTLIEEKIKNCVCNVLTHPYVKEKLKITNLKTTPLKIIAKTRNDSSIEIICQNSNEYIKTNGRNTIYINPTIISQYGFSPTEIEVMLAHELAHIACKHYLDLTIFKKIYNTSNNTISPNQFNSAYNNMQKALEVEADIVGIFNNRKWAQISTLLFQKFLQNNYTKAPTHPTVQQRLRYFKSIYHVLLKKSNPPKIPKPKIITCKNNAPRLLNRGIDKMNFAHSSPDLKTTGYSGRINKLAIKKLMRPKTTINQIIKCISITSLLYLILFKKRFVLKTLGRVTQNCFLF